MSENTPRGPLGPPDRGSGAPGAGEPEPWPPSDRPARPPRPSEPGGPPSPAAPPSPVPPGGATSPAEPPASGRPGGTLPPSAMSGGVTPPVEPPADPNRQERPAGAQPPPGAQPPAGAQPPGGPTPPPPYGGPTPPPPPYGGGGEAGGVPAPVGTFRVGEAVGYAWRKFTGNAMLWVLFTILLLVVWLGFNSANISGYQDMVTSGSMSYSADLSTGGGLLGLVGAVLVGIIQGLGTNAALREVSGQKPTFASLFNVQNLGMIVLTALLLIAAYFVGSLVCGIGLLVVLVFAVFTFQGVIDKNQNAWEAFIASFKLVGRNFGAVFLLELALLGINILGAIPCGLGWLITIPLSYLALAFAYRRLTGGPVTA